MRNYFFVSLFASCYSTVVSDLLAPFEYIDRYELMFLFRGDIVNMNEGIPRGLASIDVATYRTTTLMGQFAWNRHWRRSSAYPRADISSEFIRTMKRAFGG